MFSVYLYKHRNINLLLLIFMISFNITYQIISTWTRVKVHLQAKGRTFKKEPLSLRSPWEGHEVLIIHGARGIRLIKPNSSCRQMGDFGQWRQKCCLWGITGKASGRRGDLGRFRAKFGELWQIMQHTDEIRTNSPSTSYRRLCYFTICSLSQWRTAS